MNRGREDQGRVDATLQPGQAAAIDWDVVVVGAGPAGAAAALTSARRGASVLLVERCELPRTKVCGGCLNAAALGVLERLELGDLPARLGARPVGRVMLAARGRRVGFAPGRFAALSRATLDAALVRAAIGAGAHFLPGTLARLGDRADGWRSVELRRDREGFRVRGLVVVAADGLVGRLARSEPGFETTVEPGARFGVGAILHDRHRRLPDGELVMACGSGGYVGVVRIEDGRLDVAAALDPEFTSRIGGPENAIAAIMKEAGEAPLEIEESRSWRGTTRLSRRRGRVADHGIFLAGDAAVFIEPITGEGIAWALSSGCAVVPWALAAAHGREPCHAAEAGWRREHDELLRRRRRVCGLAARLLRHPRLVAAGARTVSSLPGLAPRCARLINDPWTATGQTSSGAGSVG